MKFLLTALLIVSSFFAGRIQTSFAKYAGGSGDSNDPYKIASAAAGAREQLPEPVNQHHSVQVASGEIPTVTAKSFDTTTWVLGFIAVATLVVCIIPAIWVYLSSPDAYERNFSTFKSVLIWPSLLYFVSATVWAIRHEK